MSSFLVPAALLAVLASVLALTLALDEDLGFDVSDDFEVEIDSGRRKLWNNKEFTTNVGKVFHLVIPKEAFGSDVANYEAKRVGGSPLPMWLLFDKTGGVFWGVPLVEDIGSLHLVIRAIASDKNISEDVTINVIETSDLKTVDKCPTNEDITVLTLLIDKGVRAIKPKHRVIAINNIAKFFGLPYSAFTLKPQLERDDITDSSVVLAGPGNLHSRSSKSTSFLQANVGCDGRLWPQAAPIVHQLKQQARDGTITEVIGLPVIGWRVRTETRAPLRSKREIDEYNGSGDYDDYYDDNYDDEEYEEDDDDSSGTTTKSIIAPSTSTSATPTPTHPHRHHHGEALNPEEIDPSIPVIGDNVHQSTAPRIEPETVPMTIPIIPETSPTTSTTTTTTTTTTTEKPTTHEEIKTMAASPTTEETRSHIAPTTQKINLDDDYDEYDEEYEDIDGEDEGPIESKTIVPILSKQSLPEVTVVNEPSTTTTIKPTTPDDFMIVDTMPPTTTTESETTFMFVEDTEGPTVVYPETVGATVPATVITTVTTQVVPSTTISMRPTTTATTTTTTSTTTPIPVMPTTTEKIVTTEEEETTVKVTTVRHIASSPQTTTLREFTESIEYGVKNFPPHIENRLKQMYVIAGKIFRFVVPSNTFKDMEDGYNLTLQFLNAKGEPLSKDSWCHFNPLRREIYGLPLEEDVSKWQYVLKATDREGASISDVFTIQVQQHRLQRVFNHEFSLYMRIEKQNEFPHFVDWCLKTLRALGRIYNTNMTEITVRNVNYSSEPVVFTWTNDSISTSHCPADEIDMLYRMLTANDMGDPSQQLNGLLAPELRVKRVTKHGLGVCETPQVPATLPTNLPPYLRNPVDQINATIGELLVFKVPDDTFYDPEDTDARTLNISLLTGDRQPIKPNNWLQFDSKNREFYGIPKKLGRSEYHLVCTDSAGLPASDSLDIVVYNATELHYNVEFSMTLETPFDVFANSASMQRKFVEKLQEIFGDRNATYIHLNPFKQKHESTIVTWHNKSLSTVKCPHDEISHLESMMKNHDRSIASRVHNIMDPEFPVSTIKVLPTGNCRVKTHHTTATARPKEETIPTVDEKSPEASADDHQYVMTFIIPAVIISIMLFSAALAACLLYRRLRTGKMNVAEDGRQSYGNKGIPVIFQEELEEKPEAGTKTPVILKDEKPPLAPPEYSKSGSLKLTDDSEPYQPPPPFTRTQDNGRQPRPKPTPTYRKPPPYVPP